VTARPVPSTVKPATLAEARDALASAPGPVLFRGGGTKLDWGATPTPASRVIETSSLDRLVEWNAADMTATVQAGMPLARLQAELGRKGQWLAVDPPLGEEEAATIGGIIAANDAGPRRYRFGSVRELVIGMVFVLSDGVVARSGGKVIKNVAGYDMTRLFCGSLGTLGLIAQVTVRLHPVSQEARTIRVGADCAAASTLLAGLQAVPVEPVAIDWARGLLLVRLEGRKAGVESQALTVGSLAGRAGLEAEVLTGAAQDEAWRGIDVELHGLAGETVIRGATLPDGLGRAEAALRAAAEGAGVSASLHSHAGLGLHTARIAGGDAAAHAAAVESWRRALVGLGGHAVVRRRAEGVEPLVSIFGGDPSAAAVMRRLKQALDPADRCAPGRWGGGW
jgi:glycolate oxidase FAD binding subunit